MMRVRSEPRSTRKLVTKPSSMAARPADDQRQQRLGDDPVLGQQARGVGAEAEEGRVAERDDAGVAQDQVEREREQAEDGDLGEDQMPAGQEIDRGQRGQPEDDLQRMPARPGGEAAGDSGMQRAGRHRRAAHRARANRPCGRQISTTIMIV